MLIWFAAFERVTERDMKLTKLNIFSFKNFISGTIIISTLYGLRCFRYPSETYKLSFFGTFSMILNLLINIFQIYQIIFQMTLMGDLPIVGNNRFLVLIQYGLLIMSFASLFIVISISFFMRKKIFKMIEKFEEFNEDIQKLFIKVNDFRDIGLLFIFFVVKYSSVLIANINLYLMKRNFLTFFVMLFTITGIYAPLEIFIGITYLALRRVHYVVNALR